MRIDHLHVLNFKGFKEFTLELQPHFNLLVGENGSGKTSVLDALAVALGLWHKHVPGHGWRNILPEEIRVEPRQAGDRITFERVLPVRIKAAGNIMDAATDVTWTRMIREGGIRTTNAEATAAEEAIAVLVQMAKEDKTVLPVLAYYGAGRAWLPTNQRPKDSLPSGQKPSRFDAYHNCLDTRVRDQELNNWFLLETAASANGGSDRPGFQAVKAAVRQCIPGATVVRYDTDRKEIVLSIDGNEQPFYNLSAGQRMMLAMVADIAIKAITLNSYLFASQQFRSADPLLLLEMTTGVVLIDEIDVHLHPSWQRRVAVDLKKVFKNIQFVCTTHSPQVIGELEPAEIRQLQDNTAFQPARSFGIDSSRILEELMGTKPRNESVDELLRKLFRSLDQENFAAARELLPAVEARLGPDDPEVTRARTLMAFLESKA